MAQSPQYTPASFAIPAMNSPSQNQVRRKRGRPSLQDPAIATTITSTSSTQVQVHPAYKPPAQQPTSTPPILAHPAYKPPPQQPKLSQVDAESFTRLVQQVQAQQATINSLLARIDVLEKARFSHLGSGPSTITDSNHRLGEALDDEYDSDSDSNSPLQQLLTEINRPQQQQAQQSVEKVQSPPPAWLPSNFVNPVPPPDQIPDMAPPPEGMRFAFILTNNNGRNYIGGGPQGASAVLNAWTGPHGYRITTRRSKIKSGRYWLTICCTWIADRHHRRVTTTQSVQDEPLTDGEQPLSVAGKRKQYENDCPFRFSMKQVDKDSGLFEVRWMRFSGVAAPHNHGPDPRVKNPPPSRGVHWHLLKK